MKTLQRVVSSVTNDGPGLPTKVEDKSDDKSLLKGNPDNRWNRAVKFAFCFLGLQVSYVLWGINQEQLMTQEYKFGRFKSSAFCVFGNRFLALFISLAIVLFRRFTSAKSTREQKEPPYYYYAPSSLSNTISSWAQYEALKFVSFPAQVLSKSCKIIPVMLVSGYRKILQTLALNINITVTRTNSFFIIMTRLGY